MFGSRSARSSPKCAGFGGKRSRGMPAQTSPVEGRYSSSQTKAPSDGRSSSAFRGAHSPAPSRERSGYVASTRISRGSLRFVSGADRCHPAGADPETPSMGSANPAGPSAERAPSSAPQPRQGAARAMTATMSHRRIPTDVRSGRGPGSVSRLRRAVRRLRSVRAADVAGKRVLVRADLNVPLEDGHVADETRIRASLPTLGLLRDRGAAAITVCSHLGRPKGRDPAYALTPVELRLRELFDGELSVLENTRFDPGETKNEPGFACRLAAGQDLFVQDAFGSAHRAHASTVGVAELLPAYAGFLLERELHELGKLLGEVERPYVVVL